jgi:hypothetical protein
VGAGQFWLYGLKYLAVTAGILIVWFQLFLERLDRGGLLEDPIVHLWGLSMLAFVLLPSQIQFPPYPFPLMFVPQRLSLFAALLFCAMVAGGRHGRILACASSLLAAAFFSALYVDMRAYNEVEAEITGLVSSLPPGARVVAELRDDSSPGLNGLIHVGAGACLGRCFDYANYEPATRQFRLRVTAPNGVAISSMQEVQAIETGRHIVTPEEAPLYSVCAADAPGPRLVLRKLAAGEKTCVVILPLTRPFFL